MTAPKAQTIQQRFGFLDNDLKTPKHDEMMIWLDENIVSVVNKLGFTRERDLERYRVLVERIANKNKFDVSAAPPYLEMEIRRIWEFPVTQIKSNFIVGFIDMKVILNVCYPDYMEKSYRYQEAGGWCEKASYFAERRLMFELKTSIPSLGELIRQIRMYQTVCENTEFVIVSPDDQFKTQIESQGIRFLRYGEI